MSRTDAKPLTLCVMKKTIYYILFSILTHLRSEGQTETLDTASIITQRFWDRHIMRPFGYEDICTNLKLSPFDRSLDSLSIRLWTGSMIGSRISTLTKLNSTWQTHMYRYNSKMESTELDCKPKLSPEKLIENLGILGYKDLPTQLDIQGFNDDVYDGTLYTLEIIWVGSYKILQYHSPQAFSDKYNLIFSKILDLLNDYFSEKTI